MKKWITLSLCLLLSGFLSGQSGNTEAKPVEGYEINGFITGKYTGKVYLVKEDGMHGPQTKVDSCEVKEGRFQFKGDTGISCHLFYPKPGRPAGSHLPRAGTYEHHHTCRPFPGLGNQRYHQ